MQSSTSARGARVFFACMLLAAMWVVAAPAGAQECPDTATAEPVTDTSPICSVGEGGGGEPESDSDAGGEGGAGGSADGEGDAVAADRIDTGAGGATSGSVPALPLAIAGLSAMAGGALFVASRRHA